MWSRWTDLGGSRLALALVISTLALAGVLGFAVWSKDGGIPTGSALDAEGEGGILQPLPPNTPVSVGIVKTRNTSSEPVQLVSARLLRLDADVRLLGFSALPRGPGPWGPNPPITALEHPLPGAVPLPDFPPLAPGNKQDDYQVAVMFALGVEPGGAGKAVGVEVVYRQGDKLRKQVFREQVYVCSVSTWGDDVHCPGVEDEMDVFGEFEDEVEGSSGRRSG